MLFQRSMIDVFIGNLNDNMQHEVCVWEPDSWEKAFRLERKIECKIMATRNPTTHIYKYGSVATPILRFNKIMILVKMKHLH